MCQADATVHVGAKGTAVSARPAAIVASSAQQLRAREQLIWQNGTEGIDGETSGAAREEADEGETSLLVAIQLAEE
eukprot:3580003-Amphidinium_carterae.1